MAQYPSPLTNAAPELHIENSTDTKTNDSSPSPTMNDDNIPPPAPPTAPAAVVDAPPAASLVPGANMAAKSVEEAFKPPHPAQPAVSSTDAPSANPNTKPDAKKSDGGDNKSSPSAAVRRETASKDDDVDSITGEINLQIDSSPDKSPHDTTHSKSNKEDAAKTNDIDDGFSSDEDDDKPAFPKSAIKRPRNSGAAEAYAKRMKEREEAERSKQGEIGEGGKDDEAKKPAAKASPAKGGSEKKKKSGASKDEGHVKMKQTQPSHVKVKHTPKVPNDAPPNRKSIRPTGGAGGSLKSPPEELLAAKKKPAKRKGSPKKTSSSAKSNKREELVSNLDGGGASPKRSKRKKKNGEEEDGQLSAANILAAMSKKPSAAAKKKTSSTTATTFQVGERIEAKYNGRGRKYYPGTIVGVAPDEDRYDVDYDDSDKDLGLSWRFIRRLEGTAALPALMLAAVEAVEEGDAAEAAIGKKKRKAKEAEKDKKPAAKRAKKKSSSTTTGQTISKEAKKTNTWNERIAMLKTFKAEYKTTDLTLAPKESPPNPLLKTFVAECRKQYKKFKRGERSALSAERIDELTRLGFDFCPQTSGQSKSNHDRTMQVKWDAQFEELERYQAEHGDCLVSTVDSSKQSTADPKLSKLGNWVRGQRKLMNKVGRKGFPADRLAKLEGIGFDFDPISKGSHIAKKQQTRFPRVNTKWEEYYQRMLQFKEQNGHVIVGPSSGEDWPGLYNWIHCQRKEYKKWQAGDEKALMFDVWVTKMNELGFQWAPMKSEGFNKMVLEKQNEKFEKVWLKHYGELKQFHQKNGHCYIPRENEKLASWLNVQRKHKRNGAKGKDTPLTDERIRLLNDIDVDWDPSISGGFEKVKQVDRDKEWEVVFNKLCEYKKVHGHADPKKKEPQLGPWACRMRMLYARNAKGETTTLNDAKVAKLQSIGFRLT